MDIQLGLITNDPYMSDVPMVNTVEGRGVELFVHIRDPIKAHTLPTTLVEDKIFNLTDGVEGVIEMMSGVSYRVRTILESKRCLAYFISVTDRERVDKLLVCGFLWYAKEVTREKLNQPS